MAVRAPGSANRSAIRARSFRAAVGGLASCGDVMLADLGCCLGGDAESIGVGFSGWQVEAKRARRGCLTAPSTIPDGDLIGVRLSRDVLGQPPRPGRCLLHTGDGTLITVSVPAA